MQVSGLASTSLFIPAFLNCSEGKLITPANTNRKLVIIQLSGGNDGLNTVVPYTKLESETVKWCQEILAKSPISIRCLKAALNADCDGQAGLQELAGNATMLFYMSEEGQEGRNAFIEKRKPNFSKFPRRP